MGRGAAGQCCLAVTEACGHIAGCTGFRRAPLLVSRCSDSVHHAHHASLPAGWSPHSWMMAGASWAPRSARASPALPATARIWGACTCGRPSTCRPPGPAGRVRHALLAAWRLGRIAARMQHAARVSNALTTCTYAGVPARSGPELLQPMCHNVAPSSPSKTRASAAKRGHGDSYSPASCAMPTPQQEAPKRCRPDSGASASSSRSSASHQRVPSAGVGSPVRPVLLNFPGCGPRLAVPSSTLDDAWAKVQRSSAAQPASPAPQQPPPTPTRQLSPAMEQFVADWEGEPCLLAACLLGGPGFPC